MDLVLDVPMRDGDDDFIASLLTDDGSAAGQAPDDVCRPLPGQAYYQAGVDVDVSSVVANSGNLGKAGKPSNFWKSHSNDSRRLSNNAKYNKVLNRLPSDHWKEDGDVFRQSEEQKRTENLQQAVIDCNDNGWTHTKLFFSHCWRDASSQERKRMLFAAMTHHGSVFWADFLDLQAQGPVPWRREIGDAIQSASKFVAVIDLQYLLSFNCLEELEYAIHYSKPIVVAVLDQEAWNLLTVVGGAEDAWTRQPSGGGRSLDKYQGQEFGPTQQPFDLKRAEHIFSTIASINFCPCRELEFAALGADGVSRRLCAYVDKDLDYTKEHAFLQSKATAWEEAEKPSDLLLEGRTDVDKWNHWTDMAEKAGSFPPVTAMQSEYVQRSVEKNKRRRGLLRGLGISAVVLIFLLMITAFFLLAWAVGQQRLAEAHAAHALRQGRVAATMLLASSTAPSSSSEIRAVVRAAEIAEKIGFTALALPYLQRTLEHLTRLPFWFIDMNSHTSPVHTVAFSPDGLYLASAGLDRTVRIREIPQGEGATGLPPFRNDVYLEAPGIIDILSWSPSGTLLAAGCSNKGAIHMPAIIVWQYDEAHGCWGERFRIPQDPEEIDSGIVKALAWSPDSEILATGNEASQQIMWYIGDAIRLDLDEPSFIMPEYGIALNRVRAVDFSPNCLQFSLGGTANNVMVVGIGAMPVLVAAPASRGGNASFTLSEDNDEFVPVHLGLHKQDDDINSAAFSPDGTLIATGGDSAKLYIYRVLSNTSSTRDDNDPSESSEYSGPALEVVKVFPSADDFDLSSDDIMSVAWSANGEVLASASLDKKVRLYKKATKKDGGEPGAEDFQLHSMFDTPDEPNSLAMPPKTNPGLLSAALQSNSVRSWKPAVPFGKRGPEWFNLDCIDEINNAFDEDFSVRGASVSLDGETFVASSYRGHICVWERNGTVWDVSAVLDFPQHPDYTRSRRRAARAVVLSPSGNRFVAGDDAGGIHGWRRTPSGWETIGNRYFNSSEEEIRVIAWSSDEKWVVAGGTRTGVWNIDSEDSELQGFEDTGRTVMSAAWRHGLDEDGCYVLATGEAANVLRIRRLCPVVDSNGAVTLLESVAVRLSSPLLHMGDIKEVAWSSSGLLASGSADGMLAIHTYKQGNITNSMPLPGHTSQISAITWGPNGKELATSADQDIVIVWDLDSDQTGQERGYTSWLSRRSCDQLVWLEQEPRRLACGRRSESGRDPAGEDPPFTYSLMFSLLDFSHQLSILRELQYGSLEEGDLIRLGLYDVASTALDKVMFLPVPKAESGSCPSGPVEITPMQS